MTLTSQQIALLLVKIPKMGPITIKKLFDHFKNLENILKAKEDKLLKINGIGRSHILEINRWKTYLSTVKKEKKN